MENNLEVLLKFSGEINDIEEEKLLMLQIDPLDPIHSGNKIFNALLDEIGGMRYSHLIGIDDVLGSYIIVEVPFDTYINEMGYKS